MSIDRFDPSLCVLVVIDVQNDFCHIEGVAAKNGKSVEQVNNMVPSLENLIARTRDVGVPLIFVRTTHGDDTSTDSWRYRTGKLEKSSNCHEGSWGAEFFKVSPVEGEYVATKHRYSAFRSPEFKSALKELNRPSLLFTGVATNICVETTLRDAMCADYYASLVEDCCAAYTISGHNSAVENVRNFFGVVTNSEALMSHWKELAIKAG